MNILFSLPDWNVNNSALFLIHILCSHSFFNPPIHLEMLQIATINIECTNHGKYPFLRDFLWLHQTADMVKFLLSADPNNSVNKADNPNSIKYRIRIIDGANEDGSRLNDVGELEWMLPRNMWSFMMLLCSSPCSMLILRMILLYIKCKQMMFSWIMVQDLMWEVSLCSVSHSLVAFTCNVWSKPNAEFTISTNLTGCLLYQLEIQSVFYYVYQGEKISQPLVQYFKTKPSESATIPYMDKEVVLQK